jgi:hypothetical protein
VLCTSSTVAYDTEQSGWLTFESLLEPSNFRESIGNGDAGRHVIVDVGAIVAFDGHQVSLLGLGVDGEVLALTNLHGSLIAGRL